MAALTIKKRKKGSNEGQKLVTKDPIKDDVLLRKQQKVPWKDEDLN